MIMVLRAGASGKVGHFIKYPVGLRCLLIVPAKLFDQRLCDFLAYGIRGSTTDLIAPQVGVNHLENYLKRLTAGG